MKERPIIFSAPMVRALLAGTKTQTRRVCKGARERSCALDWPLSTCPYGKPGDRLWVREGWAHDAETLEACRAAHEDALCGGVRYGPYYRADRVHENTGLTWRSPIHMPRWASRTTLEITDVRVQRLHEIDERDVRAEGVELREMWLYGADAAGRLEIARSCFRSLWKSVNGPESWDANPWVWALTFRRVEAEGHLRPKVLRDESGFPQTIVGERA